MGFLQTPKSSEFEQVSWVEMKSAARHPIDAAWWANHPDPAAEGAEAAYGWGGNGDRTAPFSNHFH